MLAAVAVPTCHAVEGDQVLMSDLASVDPRFAAAPGEQSIGFAPRPGGKRIFWPGELIRLAERNGVETSDPFRQICFELRSREIAPEDVAAAVGAWVPPLARIEVLEQSRFPAPLGKLIFDRPQVLREARDGSMLLHGYVLYHGNQRFPVWARVRVRVSRTLVIAVTDLRPGEEVRLDQLRLEERETGIAATGFASSVVELTGHLSRTRVSAGAPLLLSQFEPANDVARGATVNVEVRDGAALLTFDARAETSGRAGDSISVINPANHKVFQARVVGKNSVVVTPGGQSNSLQR